MNQLEGMPLSYLIGADEPIEGKDGRVIVVPYGAPKAKHGISVGYCNLFDELNTGEYGPYLHTSDTAEEYDEGQIDPKGEGWVNNLEEQFKLREKQGFEYIELDNPDAYSIEDVLGAINYAEHFGLKVIAKNPLLIEGVGTTVQYLEHPNIYGAIVEYKAGRPGQMHDFRKRANKISLPVWFVSLGRDQYPTTKSIAMQAKNFYNMGVTWSRRGEYKTCEDLLLPIPEVTV